MSVREYIGARYVPILMGEWDNTRTYEPLSIVMYQGNSYTSRQFVPVGTAITNNDFWAATGNYNAQVEAYRQEVQGMDTRLDDVEHDVDRLNYLTGEGELWIQGYMINNHVITTDKIEYFAVVARNLADDAVTERSIADGAVTAEKIADGAVTKEKIAPYAVKMYSAVSNFIGRVIYDNTKQIQSVCASDSNIYTFAANDTAHTVTITKFSLITGEKLAENTVNVDHANAAIYDYDTGYIYVNNGSNISMINPSTLAVTDTITGLGFVAPNVTIDYVTGKKYVCDNDNYPHLTVYECDYTAQSPTKTKLFTFDASIPREYNFADNSNLATQNFSVFNGEFYYASSLPNSYALLNLDNTGNIVNIYSVDTTNQIYVGYEMQGGFFTPHGEYVFAMASHYENDLTNIGCLWSIPLYGNRIVYTNLDNYHYDAHFKGGYDINTLLNPFKSNLFYAEKDAIAIAATSNRNVTIDSGTFNLNLCPNYTLGINISSGATLKLATAITNSHLTIVGPGTLDFNSQYLSQCFIGLVNGNIKGHADLQSSVVMLSGTLTNTQSGSINCHGNSIVVGNNANTTAANLDGIGKIFATPIVP